MSRTLELASPAATRHHPGWAAAASQGQRVHRRRRRTASARDKKTSSKKSKGKFLEEVKSLEGASVPKYGPRAHLGPMGNSQLRYFKANENLFRKKVTTKVLVSGGGTTKTSKSSTQTQKTTKIVSKKPAAVARKPAKNAKKRPSAAV